MKGMIVITLAMLVAAPALGAEEGPWTTKAGLGYLATTGNSESTSFNGTFDVGYNVGRWEHSLALLALGAQSTVDRTVDGVTAQVKENTAERYSLGYKTKWTIHEWDYAFGNFDYDKDKISSVEQSISETLGYGRRFIKNEVQELNGEIGVGFRQQDFIDGSDESSAIVRIGGDYRYNISPTSTFTQTLAIDIGDDNTGTVAVSALNTKIRDALALVLGFTLQNNSDVPEGFDKTDTFTSINLEYAF